MVDEVVAGEGVDSVGVAGDVGDGDRDDLAVARRRGDAGGSVEAESPGTGREQCGGHHGGHVVAGLGPLDDLGDGGASPPATSWWITFSGSAAMGAVSAAPLTLP